MKIFKTANYKKLKTAIMNDNEGDYIYIIVDNEDGSADVFNYRRNNNMSSVREGLMDNIFLDAFNSVEEAKQKYPNAEVRDSKIRADDMPMSAPDWFSPNDAGEAWGENDY